MQAFLTKKLKIFKIFLLNQKSSLFSIPTCAHMRACVRVYNNVINRLTQRQQVFYN